MFAPVTLGDLGIYHPEAYISRCVRSNFIRRSRDILPRGVDFQDMFAPIILGDLEIFCTVNEFGMSEVSPYRDNLYTGSR
jgi:hypothetical protein